MRITPKFIRPSRERAGSPFRALYPFIIMTFILTVTIILVIAAPASSSGVATGDGTWQWINPSVQGNTLMGISFVDANTGWAVGSAGTVLKTADGGTTWSPQIPAPNTCAGITPYGSGCGLKSVSFVDANNGWVVGDYGTIWRTVSGGASWTSQSLPGGTGCGGGSCIYASLNGVHFVDSLVGVAVGPSYAFATRDGGASWQQVSGVNSSHTLNAVQMVSSTTAYAVGDSGVVYRITWNGATWSAAAQAGPSTQNLYDVYFVDAQHGFAVGGGRIWRTTDGTNWAQNAAARSESIRGVTMTGNTLVVTGGIQTVGEFPGSSVILKRTSAGNWTDSMDTVAAGLAAASSNGTTDHLYAVAFPGGGSTGFASGEAGGIIKTTDTGSNWTLTAGGNAKKITGTSFINDTTGWMVAMDGSVMKTVNAGASWTSDSSGIPAGTKLRAVSFINDTTGFAVGYSGLLFDSTNAGVAYKYNGTTWSTMSVPAGVATLEAIHMTSATNGWAVGRAGASAPTGVALKTTDGSTWVFDGAGIGTDIKLYGVDATSTTDGWAVGERSLSPTSSIAVLLKYTSGAPGSWTVTEKADSTGFLGIDIVDGTTGYAVGYKSPSATPPYWQDSRIYKTGDGGTTWNTSLSTTYHNWFLSVAFINSTTGYVSGGSAGRVLKTTDGGTTWTPQSVGAGWDLNTITVVPSTWAASGHVAFVGGDNAAALRSPRPPEVESVSTAGARVEPSSTISATFTKDLTPGTVTGTSYTVKKHSDSTPVAGTISFPSGNRTPVFTPSSPLEYATQYDATFTTAITDSSGNRLVENYDWSFSTARDYWWTWYDNLSTGSQNWVLMANPSSAANNVTYKLSIGGVNQSLSQWNNGVAAPGASLTPQYPGVRNGPVNAASITGGYKGIVSQRILWGANSLEEVLGTDAEKLSNHFYWTWYDDLSPGYTNYVMVANPGTTSVFYRVKVAGIPRTTGEILPGGSAFWRDGALQGGPVEVEGCQTAFSPIDVTCSSPADVLASQRVLSNNGGAFNEIVGTAEADLSSNYLWTWYDNHSPGAQNWIMIANPGVVDMHYEIWIGGVMVQNDTTGGGTIPPGGFIAPTFDAPEVPTANGPVQVKTFNGEPHDLLVNPMNSIASQRIIWGPSFGEVPGYPYSALTNTYHWTWYDQSQANVFNWVMVSKQDFAANNVWYKVLVAGVERKGCTQIPASGRDVPSFPGLIGGPVEVRSYSDSSCTVPSAPGNGIMASQRVLWKGYFNETLGTVLN